LFVGCYSKFGTPEERKKNKCNSAYVQKGGKVTARHPVGGVNAPYAPSGSWGSIDHLQAALLTDFNVPLTVQDPQGAMQPPPRGRGNVLKYTSPFGGRPTATPKVTDAWLNIQGEHPRTLKN